MNSVIDIDKDCLLIYGPTGSGKTTNVLNLGKLENTFVHRITGRDIRSITNSSNPIKHILKNIITDSSESYTHILFFDDIDDTFCEDNVSNVSSNNIHKYQFIEMVKELKLNDFYCKNCKIKIYGSVTRIESLDISVRKIFDNESILKPPDKDTRCKLLIEFLEEISNSYGIAVPDEEKLKEFSESLFGYSITDLKNLVYSTASQLVLLLGKQISPVSIEIDDLVANKRNIDKEKDLYHSSKVETKWDDIYGLNDAKQELLRITTWFYKYISKFKKLGIDAPKGVLLYGPPGTGKTLLAKAVANESNANFLSVSIPDIIKSEVGESEKAIANYFKIAKEISPCILFIDEFQALFGKKRLDDSHGKNLISQLILEMDNISLEHSVLIFAATNEITWIDQSFLRPGRFDKQIFIGPPDDLAREDMIRDFLKKMNIDEVDVISEVVKELNSLCKNFTGAEIKSLFQKSGMNMLKRCIHFGEDGIMWNKEEKKLKLDDIIHSLESFKF